VLAQGMQIKRNDRALNSRNNYTKKEKEKRKGRKTLEKDYSHQA